MSQFKKPTIEQFESFLHAYKNEAKDTAKRLSGFVDLLDEFSESAQQTSEFEEAISRQNEAQDALYMLGLFKKSLNSAAA